MPTPTFIDTCKMALRITTNAYDTEIQSYIDAGKLDLGIAGVIVPQTEDNLINKALLTYVRMSFGSPSNYDRLKSAYDEQKAQLMNATGYTDWSG